MLGLLGHVGAIGPQMSLDAAVQAEAELATTFLLFRREGTTVADGVDLHRDFL